MRIAAEVVLTEEQKSLLERLNGLDEAEAIRGFAVIFEEILEEAR